MRRVTIGIVLLGLVSCERGASTPPSEPGSPAVVEAEEPRAAEEATLHGIGHCCRDGACEGKEYTSAHAFAQDCAAMEATEARWCASSCEVVEEPYSCTCAEAS